MTGNLSISNSIPVLDLHNTNLDVTSTTAPSTTIGSYLQVTDKNNQYVSHLYTSHDTYNNFSQGFAIDRKVNGATTTASFSVNVDASGNDFALATNGIKQSILNWAYPSATYIGLQLGASGATYIAPADGYIFISGTQAGSSGYVFLNNSSNGMGMVSQPPNVSTFEIRAYIPVAKGQTFTVDYADVYIYVFRFIYAIGEQ